MSRIHHLAALAVAALPFVVQAQATGPSDATPTTSQRVTPGSTIAPPTSPHESAPLRNNSTNNASTQDAVKPGRPATDASTATPMPTRENTARPETKTGSNTTLPSHDRSLLNR